MMISRLCGLCAMSALLERLLPDDSGRSGMRMICGLLMIHMTLTMGMELVDRLTQANELDEMIRILIG